MNKNRFFFIIIIFICFSSYSQIKFEEKAVALGVEYTVGETIAFLGGYGVAFYDFDNDGWDDITFASEDGKNLKFFKNNNGSFASINLNIAVNHQTKQVNWVDFDNDGDKDFFVTSNINGSKLFENTGNLSFQDITLASGLPTQNLYTSGAAWGDYNNDGFLDVFLSSKNPNLSTQKPNYLYKNNGDGTFTDVSVEAGIDRLTRLSFCSVFFDYNNDGWQDIYIANDKEINGNLLYKNNGDGTFTDVSDASGANISINAMTTTVGDYNNDGWQDIYVTNLGDSALLKNNGDGTFTDVATSTGTLFSSVGWGAVFLDGDNDSDIDLYVSGARFNSVIDRSAAFYENKLETGSEVFEIPTNAGFENDESHSHSNAIGDINNDGLPDFVVTNISNFNVGLWENKNTDANNWLKINLQGTSSNRDGVGARIEVSVNGKSQFRYTHNGEGYLSQNSSSEFIGLGENTSVDFVKVTWLGGSVDVFTNVSSNQTMNIVEGTGTLSTHESSSTAVSIYPNPVVDILFVKSATSISKIEVYDLLCKKLYAKTYESNEIDVSKLTSGLYLLKVFSGNKVETIKMMKE
tara:strand:- start:27668 stop:29398 length:1731 start_codon:yes stop_codon:yes gene_type:complete